MGYLSYVVRKRLAMTHEKTVYLSVGKTIPSTRTPITEVYTKHLDEDGFLYVTYACEHFSGN